MALNLINDLELNHVTLKFKVSKYEMFIYTIQIYKLGNIMTENYRESDQNNNIYPSGIKITKTK